jgi:hypothetical protein
VRQYLPRQSFTGLSPSPDGRTLYAVAPTEGLIGLDLASAQAHPVDIVPAQHPWGIAWVSQ